MKVHVLQWRTIGAQPRPVARSASQTEALESWSPVCIAWAIDQGLMHATPLQLTARGWRWVNANGPKERAIFYGLIGEELGNEMRDGGLLADRDAPRDDLLQCQGLEQAAGGAAGVPGVPDLLGPR
jgi:hypothetical protein